MVEPCNKHHAKQFLHPIIEWSTDDVWEYIKTYNLPCRRDLAQYPHIRKMWKYGCQKIIDKRRASGKKAIFNCAEDMYEWWLSDKGMPTKLDEINIFGILTDEGST